MGGVIGLDVGGANTKAVWRNGDERRALSRPFEVWRDREALAAVLREVVAGVAGAADIGEHVAAPVVHRDERRVVEVLTPQGAQPGALGARDLRP